MMIAGYYKRLAGATATNVSEHTIQAEIPAIEIREGPYLVRLARTRQELIEALELRFQVFNLELGEGLAASFQTGRDEDEFDAVCDHLIVLDADQNKVIGTYRMQTLEMATAGNGFYTATEFDLSRLPANVLEEGVELGRACVAVSHRNTQALLLLWRGLAAYLVQKRKRYLFGCCSLTSQHAREGQQVMAFLKEQGHRHPFFYAPPHPEFLCLADDSKPDELGEPILPRLFRAYLRYGAKVCSPPAIDRRFKTIDFLILFDITEMSEFAVRLFFNRRR